MLPEAASVVDCEQGVHSMARARQEEGFSPEWLLLGRGDQSPRSCTLEEVMQPELVVAEEV